MSEAGRHRRSKKSSRGSEPSFFEGMAWPIPLAFAGALGRGERSGHRRCFDLADHPVGIGAAALVIVRALGFVGNSQVRAFQGELGALALQRDLDRGGAVVIENNFVGAVQRHA